jgi:hypothetical protein
MTMNSRSSRRLSVAAGLVCLAAVLGGCLGVQASDLFLLTRAGVGRNLTLLVSDGGTVRCNGGAAKPLPDKLLVQARDLATTLNNDAKQHLQLARTANTVATYTVKLQNGTISFPDTAARAHSELAQLELLTVQIAQGPCGLSG